MVARNLSPVIQEAVDRISGAVRPRRVILFGSWARGDARPDSDVDLYVLLDAVDDPRATAVSLRSLLHDLPMSKDILVSGVRRFDERRNVLGTIERAAASDGVVVFERA